MSENYESPDVAETKRAIAAVFEPPEPGAARFAHEVDLTAAGVDLTDSTQEDALRKDDEVRNGAVIPEKPADTTVLPSPVFESNPAEEARSAVRGAFEEDFDFGKVIVTAAEKDRFLRCGLHDEQMFYDVEVEGIGLNVRVNILPESYTDAAMAALSDWVKNEVIGEGNMQWLLGFQLMHAWMQISRIADQPTDWLEAHLPQEGRITYRKLRELLANDATVEPLRSMSAVRWRAIALAIRIAEHKQKLCLEALLNRDFFTSAGTD
jgi:hypothetical protein